jgi:hypothetical protein
MQLMLYPAEQVLSIHTKLLLGLKKSRWSNLLNQLIHLDRKFTNCRERCALYSGLTASPKYAGHVSRFFNVEFWIIHASGERTDEWSREPSLLAYRHYTL